MAQRPQPLRSNLSKAEKDLEAALAAQKAAEQRVQRAKDAIDREQFIDQLPNCDENSAEAGGTSRYLCSNKAEATVTIGSLVLGNLTKHLCRVHIGRWLGESVWVQGHDPRATAHIEPLNTTVLWDAEKAKRGQV